MIKVSRKHLDIFKQKLFFIISSHILNVARIFVCTYFGLLLTFTSNLNVPTCVVSKYILSPGFRCILWFATSCGVPLWLYHQEGIRPNGDAEASVSCASLLGFVALLRTLLLVKHATNTLYAMPWDSGVTLYQGAPGSKFSKAPPSRSAKGTS